jgi:hypothetical protein
MQPDNLLSLKDDMVAFIAGHGMRRFNGYVTEEVPTVIFEDEDPTPGRTLSSTPRRPAPALSP